jgi:hypothetical protein
MAEETMLRDLFDRWERVWHEGEPAANQVRLCRPTIPSLFNLVPGKLYKGTLLCCVG